MIWPKRHCPANIASGLTVSTPQLHDNLRQLALRQCKVDDALRRSLSGAVPGPARESPTSGRSWCGLPRSPISPLPVASARSVCSGRCLRQIATRSRSPGKRIILRGARAGQAERQRRSIAVGRPITSIGTRTETGNLVHLSSPCPLPQHQWGRHGGSEQCALGKLARQRRTYSRRQHQAELAISRAQGLGGDFPTSRPGLCRAVRSRQRQARRTRQRHKSMPAAQARGRTTTSPKARLTTTCL